MLLAAALAALGLHGLLWTAAHLRSRIEVAQPATAPVRMLLRLAVAPPEPLSPPLATPQLAAREPAARKPVSAVTRQPPTPPANADTPPTSATTPSPPPAAAAGTATAQPNGMPSTAFSPSPLDLRLPSARPGTTTAPSTRSQALNDPRTGERMRADERFGLAFAGLAIRSEEQLADGTLRIRSGTSCVLAHPARSAGLDPYNNAIRTIPRHVEPC